MSLILLAGCSAPSAPADEGEGPVATPTNGRAHPKIKGPRVPVAELLPIREDRVRWYGITYPAAQDRPRTRREAAFFPVRDPQLGYYLESVGLGLGSGSPLRLLVKGGELRAYPDGLQGGHHVIYSEAKGGGTWEALTTPKGEVKALKLAFSADGARVLYWFVSGRGLMKMELWVGEALGCSLLFEEEVELGPRDGGYPRRTPALAWEGMQQAIRRLDVDALPGFLAPALRARLRPTARETSERLGVPEQHRPPPEDPVADRIRLVVAELLEVRLQIVGAWRLDFKKRPPVASARALLTAAIDGELRSGPARVKLEWRSGGWQWASFEALD